MRKKSNKILFNFLYPDLFTRTISSAIDIIFIFLTTFSVKYILNLNHLDIYLIDKITLKKEILPLLEIKEEMLNIIIYKNLVIFLNLFSGGQYSYYFNNTIKNFILKINTLHILELINILFAFSIFWFLLIIIPLYLTNQTIGKRCYGIKILKYSKEYCNVGPFEIILRESVGKIISVISIIGLFLPLFNKKHNFLHDYIFKTATVNANVSVEEIQTNIFKEDNNPDISQSDN